MEALPRPLTGLTASACVHQLSSNPQGYQTMANMELFPDQRLIRNYSRFLGKGSRELMIKVPHTRAISL